MALGSLKWLPEAFCLCQGCVACHSQKVVFKAQKMLFYLISDFHADLLSDKLSILKLEEKIQTRNEIVSEKLQNFHQLKLSIEMKEKDPRFMTGELL